MAIQDFAGYSEAVASIQAYQALSPGRQNDLLNFLRVQFIHNQPGSL